MGDFLKKALQSSKNYLGSDEALKSIERDPYWPKWNSPWWHMSLMNELGIAKEIPEVTVQKMVDVLKKHYLPNFPITEAEIPLGTDVVRQVACLCAVGNMYQILFNADVDVDRELPWMRSWFLRYQLPDGGLNCDETAYTKPVPKSSIVTTVACMEAVLFCRNRDLTENEKNFLNRGANYLLKHRLFRKASTGEVIDIDWLEIRFPRFYEYDFLRGFYFLTKWHEESGFDIPTDLFEEIKKLVLGQMSSEGIRLKRYNLFDKRSYNPTIEDKWTWGVASEFELMKAVSFEGAACEPMTIKWNEIEKILKDRA